MENAILDAATTQGVWVLMFVFLFLYTIKNSEKREANYQSLLQNLSEKYNLLLDVKEDLEKLKKKIIEDI